MGIKVFDLPPDGIVDGAVGEIDKKQSTSEDVKPQIITEQVSPEQSTDSDIPDPLPCPAKASWLKAETDIIVTARNTIESDVIVCLREFIIISSE